jgi:hypothetical protein
MARPRGYAEWKPNEDSLRLVGQIQEILDEYRAQLPMTARQIFYRLVGAFDYDKTERAYSNLCEKLVRARRAQMISFADIRDDGTVEHAAGGGYGGPGDFWHELKESGQWYRRPAREGQEYRIELWCEAAGMAPQLARVAEPYGVPVYSTGGFSSVTVTHEIGERVTAAELPTIFLHVGDFDPSGESIFDAIAGDALHFVAGMNGGGLLKDHVDRFRARRVALTEDQVTEHDLPTAPAKRSDSRSVNWDAETCQLEALPPDDLAEIIREAIEEWTDLDQLRAIEQQGEDERDLIIAKLEEAEL